MKTEAEPPTLESMLVDPTEDLIVCLTYYAMRLRQSLGHAEYGSWDADKGKPALSFYDVYPNKEPNVDRARLIYATLLAQACLTEIKADKGRIKSLGPNECVTVGNCN